MNESDRRQIIALWESRVPISQMIRMLPYRRCEAIRMIGELRANGTLKPRDKKSILRQRIVEEYNRGTTDKYELGKIFGINADTAQRYVSKAIGEWHRPPQNYKPKAFNQKAQEIIAELENGELSMAEIARKFAVSKQYVFELKKKVEERE